MMNEELQLVNSTKNFVEANQTKIELDIYMILSQLGINQTKWPLEFKDSSSALLGQMQ